MKKLLFVLLTCFISMQAVAGELEDIVDQHRKMIILLDGASELDPASLPIFAARHHYVIKHERIHSIIDQAEQLSEDTSKAVLLSVSQALIDKSDQYMQKHPADLLAFVDLADELLAIEQDRGASVEVVKELVRLTMDLEDISNVYRNEYSKLLNKFKTRGLVKYESWQGYLTFLKAEFGYEELLNEVHTGKAELYRSETRGSALAKDQKDQTAPEEPQVIWGNELPDKTVVLTFDDGPNHSRTPKILDILQEYEVKAYFFSVGRNLGKIDKDGEAKVGRNKSIAQRLLNEGHILANHSFSHAVLTKLKTEACNTELSQTNTLIKAVSGEKPAIFRPPYGSQNDQLGEIAKKLGLISVMWNIDSLDWADPIPDAIADRVLRQLDEEGKGILLFHDIHKQTVKALPEILNGLHQRGYKVVTLDGTSFDQNKSGIPQLPKSEKA